MAGSKDQGKRGKSGKPRAIAGVAIAAALASSAGLAWAQAPQGAGQPTRSITIYSSMAPGAVDPNMYRPSGGRSWGGGMGVPGYAIVRDDRTLTLREGRGEVRLTDVAALIDPTTVSFRSLTDPAGTRVIDQNFQFDLVSTEKLLERFLDQSISVDATRGTANETITGTLLSAQGGQLVLRSANGGVEIVNGYSGVNLPSLPGGLITRPTLVWNVLANRGGEHTTRVSYETKGITWWADYNVVYSEPKGQASEEALLDVSAWVSILNQSGGSYADTRLKLIAGEVQRAPVARQDMRMRGGVEMAVPMASAPGFEQKSFFEYHMYTLSEPTTIPDNSTKQLELFPTARNVQAERVLVYAGQGDMGWWGDGVYDDPGFGGQAVSSVDVYLRFKNERPKGLADGQPGLGVPLPAGRVRVSKLDESDGSLEFIGEDTIRHTPKDETLLLRLGKSFDVVGTRTQTQFNVDSNRRRMTETIRVEIRNRKDVPQRVVVQEKMLRSVNWQFAGDAPQHEKLDARTVLFPLVVPANATQTVTYQVLYTW